MGPEKGQEDKSSYWLTTWQDPPNTEVAAKHDPKTIRKNIPVVEKLPAPACGKDCVKSAQSVFGKVNERLAGLLPDDPDWASYPKALIRDPNSKEAVLDKALHVEAEDPIGNADVFDKGEPEGKAVVEQRGAISATRNACAKRACGLGRPSPTRAR